MSWRTLFWLAAFAAVALGGVVGLAFGAETIASWVRAVAVSVGLATATLALVPALLYQHRFHTASLDRRDGMLRPSDIWGMAASYLTVLLPMVALVIERFHYDLFPSVSAAVLLSSALAWRWYYHLIARQLRLTPEPVRQDRPPDDLTSRP